MLDRLFVGLLSELVVALLFEGGEFLFESGDLRGRELSRLGSRLRLGRCGLGGALGLHGDCRLWLLDLLCGKSVDEEEATASQKAIRHTVRLRTLALVNASFNA